MIVSVGTGFLYALLLSHVIITLSLVERYKATDGTTQFKLDRTHVQHGLNITHFSFTHVQACMCMQD